MSEEKTKVSKTRNYATIVYPESAPKNWKEKLEQCFVPSFISPLHKDDVNADGQPKKEHYHVMIMFDNTKPEIAINSIIISCLITRIYIHKL